MKTDGLKLIRNPSDVPLRGVYWKVDKQSNKHSREFLKSNRAIDEKYPIGTQLDELAAKYEDASPERKPAIVQEIKVRGTRQTRSKLMIPHDFEPSRQKGIVAYIAPHADALSVIFTQNGSKDEWRDLGGWSKTSHIYPWPGKHLTFCRILEDIQMMVRSAGGDYEIRDELGYCDDYAERRTDDTEVETVESE